MTKASPLALADFLNEYRRDNVTTVSAANLMDASAEMLRSQHARIEKLEAALEQSQSRIEELITEATRAQYMSMKRRIRIEKLEAALERAQDLLGKTMSAGIRLQARIDELEAEIETPANDGK